MRAKIAESFHQFTIKNIVICAETAFSLILASLRGTGAHRQKGDAIRAAETVRMHPRTNLMADFGFFFSLIVGSIAAIVLSGCGYSIHPQSSLYTREIAIGLIENKTLEPKLQDKLHKALTEEFMKQGVKVDSGAEYRITGTVNSFDLAGLSEKGGVIVEYRVTVGAEFRLLDHEGRVVTVKNISSPFIVVLTDRGDLGGLLAIKDIAEERAISDLAMEVVGAFIFK